MLREYRTLLPYFRKYRLHYAAGILCLILTDAGLLLIPQFLRQAINRISSGSIDLSAILKIVLIMIGIAGLVAVGRFFWRFFIQGASRHIERELREQIFYHLLDMSSTFYGRNKTGDIMARMTNDMKAIRMASGMAFVAFIDGLFMAMAILIILFSRYPRLTLVTIIPLPFITIMVLFAGGMLGKRFKRVQEGFSLITERVQESLSGIRVIKTFTQEEFILEEFGEANDEYRQANMALIRIWGFIFPMVSFLSGLTACLLLYFGGRQVIMNTLAPGDFVAVMSYLGMLIWPMIGAGFTVNLIQRGGASLQRINKILDEKPEITNTPAPLEVPPLETLEIRDLTFRFPGAGEPVLSQLSLNLKAGDTLGILGRTGSGKTTLIRLIPRILDSPAESILINGQPLHDLELSALRSAMSLVPQETFLFSRTIRENILFSCEDASDEELNEVVYISTLERDLKNFPDGLDTQVGEKGVTLSGGQKQRIALARALLSNPEIMILDDALSAVDTRTEEFILSRFLERRKGKTNIIISHRVSTLQNTDRIIVLDKGQIVQSGTHEDLKEQEGFYRKIHQLQTMEEGAVSK